MIKLDGLEGREFIHGSVDCFGLLRDFYKLNFNIDTPDIARPDEWWEPDENGNHLNLYMDHFHECGFSLFNGHPRHRQPGDVILMAIRSPVANHGAVLFPGEMILHHLVGQRSGIESYNRPLYRDTTVGVLRHPAVDPNAFFQEVEIDVMTLVPEHIRKEVEAARQERGDV